MTSGAIIMAIAGWCGWCGAYVYVMESGSCPAGHDPGWITGHYEVPDPPGWTGGPLARELPAIAAVASGPGTSAGSERVAVPEGVAAPEPPAASGNLAALIAEASDLADRSVRVERSGESVMVQSDSLSAGRIADVLDRALALAPGDVDLMLAKVDALALGMQFKTAEEVLDEVLASHPESFEARTRKEHWGEWGNVFTLPHWSETATELAAPMVQDFGQARSVQMVRSGVKPVPAIVRIVQPGEMAPSLGSQTRSVWEPVWSATPSGAIVAHYLVVDDNPADPYRAEAFLPLWRPEKATRMNGYWLLGQLAAADGCFITLAEGTRVIYNRWYSFPATVKAHLAAMVGRLDSAEVARDPDTFRQAMQWHMNNFDLKVVGFEQPLSDAQAGVGAT